MSDNVMALDIGTQSSRAAVVSESGDIAGIEQIKHEVDSPHPSWAQQRPDDWWAETQQAIQNVLRETGTAPESIAVPSSCVSRARSGSCAPAASSARA